MLSFFRIPRPLRHIAIFGAAGDGWSVFAARTVSQISQFAIFIVAARLLSPQQFGLFAVVSGIAILLAKLGEAGWREFVIASRDKKAVDQAMTASILGGSITMTLCLFAAGAAHLLGRAEETIWLFGLFSVWLLPAALTAVQSGMMVRQGRLKALSLAQGICEFAGLVVSVAALVNGAGVLALVYGRLVSQIASVACLFTLTRWAPPLRLERATARDLTEFSKQILATRLISFFRSYSATLSIGSLIGAASAGYLRAAERLVLSMSEVLAETFQTLAWKTFNRPDARAGGFSTQHLGNEAAFFHPILLAISAPIFIGLALVAENLIEVVLGPQWHPAALVVSIIAVRQLILMPAFLTEPLLAIAGEIHRAPPVSAMTATISILLVVLCAPWGIVAVALGQLAAAVFSVTMAARLQARHAGVSFRTVSGRSAGVIPALAAMAIGVLFVDHAAEAAGMAPTLILLLQIATGGLVYGATLLALQTMTTHRRRLFARPVPA